MDDTYLWMDAEDLQCTLANPRCLADVLRLVWIAEQNNVKISPDVAALAWGAESQSVCASWLILHPSNEANWRCMQPWIKRAEEIALTLHAG